MKLDRMSRETWKPTLEAVRRILWEDWDPIGVNDHPGAIDEYDSYAPFTFYISRRTQWASRK